MIYATCLQRLFDILGVKAAPVVGFQNQWCPMFTGERLQSIRGLLRGSRVSWKSQLLDSLVRSLKVVGIDKMTYPPTCIFQVQNHRRTHTFPPQRAPEPFDFLRPARRRDDLSDAATKAMLNSVQNNGPNNLQSHNCPCGH
jgi:hypothetical protein